MNVARAYTIQGWMSESELRFLAKLASESKLIVEAGCFKGRSTRAMADNTAGYIHAIDPWDGKYEGEDNARDDARQLLATDPDGIRKEFYINLFEHITSGKVIPHTEKFHHIWIPNTDMVFIDANHSYEMVKRDILHGIMLLSGGGILAGHDYRGEWPGVIRAVDEVFGRGIQTEDTIWWINL